MNVSLYKSVSDTIGVQCDYRMLLDAIRDGRWKDRIEHLRTLSKEDYDMEKISLPGICFSGVFESRNDKKIISYTKMICIDIDKIPEDDIGRIYAAVKNDIYTHCLFISPSDSGLKILVKVSSDKDDHIDAFKQIEEYYKGLGIEVDPSGKNVSRLCFVSWDEDLVINDDSKVFEVKVEKKPDPVINSRHGRKEDPRITEAERWNKKHLQYTAGTRNSYIHSLSCILNELGVDSSTAINYCSTNYDLPQKEIITTVGGVYKRNTNKFNTKQLREIASLPKSHIDYDKSDISTIHSVENIYDDMFATYDITNTISSCISDVDYILHGGLVRGNSYGVFGVPQTYKSILAQFMAIENAKKNDVASIYYSAEMSGGQFITRLMKKELNEDLGRKMRSGEVNKGNYKSYIEKFDSKIRNNVFAVTDIGFSYKRIINDVKHQSEKIKKEISLVVVDGLSSMEDCAGGEIYSAIQNSLYLKEVAKEVNAAIVFLCHVRTGVDKHIRDLGSFARGGTKILGNVDGYFSNSLLIDPQTNELVNDEIMYRTDSFHLKFTDKRGSGGVINKIMMVKTPLELEVTNYNPDQFEVKLKK